MTSKLHQRLSFRQWLEQDVNWKSDITIRLFSPKIRVLGVLYADDTQAVLREGKWINGRYDRNIRIDRNSHFASTDENGLHGHVYGRRDRDNALVVVKFDGTKSHGKGGNLHPDDADALRSRGFKVPRTNIVEYAILDCSDASLLLEQFQI